MRTHIINYGISFKVFILVLLFSFVVKGLFAQKIVVNEDKHNSIALIKFAEQIKTDDRVEIGIIGENHNLTVNLKKLISQQKLDHKIQIKEFKSAAESSNCDLYFITTGYNQHFDKKIATKAISKHLTTAYKISFEDGKSSIKGNSGDKKINLSAS